MIQQRAFHSRSERKKGNNADMSYLELLKEHFSRGKAECQALGFSSFKTNKLSAHKTTHRGQLAPSYWTCTASEASQSLPGNYFFFQGTAAEIQSEVNIQGSIIVSRPPYKHTFQHVWGQPDRKRDDLDDILSPQMKTWSPFLSSLGDNHIHTEEEKDAENLGWAGKCSQQIPQPYIIEQSRFRLTHVYENQNNILNA